jgi:hypothetical protein
LGHSNTVSAPEQLDGASNWMTVATLDDRALAIKTDGTLWTWGRGFAKTPVQIGLETDWAAVSVGVFQANGVHA